MQANFNSSSMGGFDSSDEENDNTAVDTTNLHIDWLDLTDHGIQVNLGVSALPGCRFKDTWRSISHDIETIKAEDIQDIFVLCTKGELSKYRVQNLLEAYKDAGLSVHHQAFLDGQTPSVTTMCAIVKDLRETLNKEHKPLIHCYGGLGRSCLVVASLLLNLDTTLTPEVVIDRIKAFRGSGAVQSVKQYNFINDFRENVEKLSSPNTNGDSESTPE